MRSIVVTPSATTMPGGRLARAISTPSSGCRRMTGAGVIGGLLEIYRVPDAGPRPGQMSLSLVSLRLAGRFLAGLRDLHLGVGRHQSAVVEQGHELEAHVDRAHRAVGAAAVNAGIKATLAAFPDDLLVNLEDLRLVTIELGHQA